jgi:methylenetetrahydrofolate reductase (NADPH)
MNQGTPLSGDALKQGIADFLEGYTIETTPHDAGKLEEIVAELPAGTRVYVAHPPGSPIDDVVDLSVTFKQRGLTPVPHIIARKLSSKDQLERALATLAAAGVDEALCIAGDIVVEDNAFESSLEVLQTGLFGQYGFKEVGVAGHPEGSQAIGEARVKEALAGKSEFARTAPFRVRLVTQFGFDAEAVVKWERATAAEGVAMPIHAGVAGPASLRQLIKFAMMCGVGASARMLKNRTAAMADLIRTQAPDDLITYFVQERAANPASRIQKLHFFAFGGVVKCAKWANAVRAGRFDLNGKGTGFEVIKAA